MVMAPSGTRWACPEPSRAQVRTEPFGALKSQASSDEVSAVTAARVGLPIVVQ
ncbi:Uncharacterised protein [Mycobacteroides abscessus subsp. abscessus]|nr:Uncharacterised protein [Mycobacteroides abscessus subsp. abscessus]